MDKEQMQADYRAERDELENECVRLRAERDALREASRQFVAWIDSGKRGMPDEEKLAAAVKSARSALARVQK